MATPLQSGDNRKNPVGGAQLASLTGSGSPGISLVTCCRNRTDNLKIALTSWLKLAGIDEIVIVDWSSETLLATEISKFIASDARIRVIRVQEEQEWVLTYAYNVGFRCASHASILKVDADIVIRPEFFQKNELRNDCFLAGNWRQVSNDQAHINGFFLVRKSDLAAIGGFNEFITNYGWDDDDLYDRLTALGLQRSDIDPTTIYHIPHDDEARSEAFKRHTDDDSLVVGKQLSKTSKYGIRRNYYVANLMPTWSQQHQMVGFAVVDTQEGHATLQRLGGEVSEVPPIVREQAGYFALKDVTWWNHGIDPSIGKAQFDSLMSGTPSELETFLAVQPKQRISNWLYRKLHWAWLRPSIADPLPGMPSVIYRRAKLFIDAQHGLGNRLRAIGSGAAIAQATDRELVIVWEPDPHCNCQFSDLFDYEGAVMAKGFGSVAAANGIDFVTCMELEKNSKKGKRISLRKGEDFYVRSAYVLNSPHTSYQAENDFLRRLSPVEAVRELVSSVRSPNDLAVHIRMVGGDGFEHLPYEMPSNWKKTSHKKITHWRRKSHYSNFMTRIDQLTVEGRAERMFLAADQPETYDAFCQRYGDRVVFLQRTLYDRSAEQLMYALADALLLGRAPVLLGSTWSSFSELAQRLSDKQMKVEFSGKDF